MSGSCYSCYRNLAIQARLMQPSFFMKATQILVQSLVITSMDDCNSLLAGLSTFPVRIWLLIQDRASHLVLNLTKRCHINQLLHVYWLPVDAPIPQKTKTFANKAQQKRTNPGLFRNTSETCFVPQYL